MRTVTAHFWRKLPHELGRLPLTYFQTLFDASTASAGTPPARTDGDDATDVVSVDVDELIRKGQRSGFGAT